MLFFLEKPLLTCPKLQPANGFRYHGHTKVNQVEQFGCEKGYLRSGRKSLTCQSNGEWDGLPPNCTGDAFRLPFYMFLPKFWISTFQAAL